jgi:hypothetical protein
MMALDLAQGMRLAAVKETIGRPVAGGFKAGSSVGAPVRATGLSAVVR